MKTEPRICEKFADNGEHSHWELINTDNGETLWKESQSSPKIKQLEWVEVYKSIFNTNTSFKYAYEIHVNDDGSTILFDSSAGKPKRFINLKDAKSAAQRDFEKRIKECLE